MQAYWVSYLSDHPENASARPEPSGLYLHRILMRAAQPRDITRELRQRGATTVEIKPAKRSLISFWRNRVTPEMQHDFLLQLSFLVEKMSPDRAFEAVAQAAEGSYRVRLEAGRQVFMQGGSFTDAVKAIEMFDESTLAIFSAAEPIGEIPQAVLAALELHKSHQRNNLASKLVMGMLVAEVIQCYLATLTMRTRLIPEVESRVSVLKDPERVALLKQQVFVACIAADAALIVGALIGLAALVGLFCYFDESGRRLLRRILSKTPVISKVFFDQHMAAVASGLAALLPRIHFEQAIRLVGSGVTNPAVASYLKSVEQRIEAGEPSHRAMVQPPLQSQELTLLSVELDDRAQLPSVLKVIAERRLASAQAGSARLRLKGHLFTYGYLLGVLALAWYLLQAASGNLESMLQMA